VAKHLEVVVKQFIRALSAFRVSPSGASEAPLTAAVYWPRPIHQRINGHSLELCIEKYTCCGAADAALNLAAELHRKG
jgi:hypothetical protein